MPADGCAEKRKKGQRWVDWGLIFYIRRVCVNCKILVHEAEG
jgi:hypothetical protein